MSLACLCPFQDSLSELPEGAMACVRVYHGPAFWLHDGEEPPATHLPTGTQQPCPVSVHLLVSRTNPYPSVLLLL